MKTNEDNNQILYMLYVVSICLLALIISKTTKITIAPETFVLFILLVVGALVLFLVCTTIRINIDREIRIRTDELEEKKKTGKLELKDYIWAGIKVIFSLGFPIAFLLLLPNIVKMVLGL